MAAVTSWPVLAGKGAVKLLLDGSGAPVALDELSAVAGAAVPPHKHESSDELLYILDGKGTTTVAGRSFAVERGRRRAHSRRVSSTRSQWTKK